MIVAAGTSACPNGLFYCWNKGHKPRILNASFVDDGICGESDVAPDCGRLLYYPPPILVLSPLWADELSTVWPHSAAKTSNSLEQVSAKKVHKQSLLLESCLHTILRTVLNGVLYLTCCIECVQSPACPNIQNVWLWG